MLVPTQREESGAPRAGRPRGWGAFLPEGLSYGRQGILKLGNIVRGLRHPHERDSYQRNSAPRDSALVSLLTVPVLAIPSLCTPGDSCSLLSAPCMPGLCAQRTPS